MIKIPTLYKKNPDNLALVIDEINPGCEWVFTKDAIATRKFDGTACAIINRGLYKRYDVKKGREVPAGAIPCQEPDSITGHWPHWVKCIEDKPEDKYFWEGFESMIHDSYESDPDAFNGTYELCGPKVQGNPEKIRTHMLVRHGSVTLVTGERDFQSMREFLEANDIEGVVFHNKADGRMCKLRKSDYGIKR